MQQTDYLGPMCIKEEIREHREQDLSIVLALQSSSPNAPIISRRLQKRPILAQSLPIVVQSVTIESEGQKRNRKRRLKETKMMKYGLWIIFLIGIFYAVDLIDDWYSSGPEMNEILPDRIQREYSIVQSINDLTTDFVDVWCYDGHSQCDCQDPLQPSGRDDLKYWHRIHELNKEASESAGDIDILFLGDSITEGWKGTSYGHSKARAQDVPKVFHKYFSNEAGKYVGLALGISGDTSPDLLWRIQNGELPDTLNPTVIWLLIGTNDLGKTWCSPELVIIGILRVVEEIRLRKPSATIVINGVLPRTFHRKGHVMKGRSNFFRFKQDALPSLWQDIVAINEDLELYAESKANVLFYNTNLFFVNKDAPINNLQIDSKLMPDRLHPSTVGYEMWAQDIVKTLDDLLG